MDIHRIDDMKLLALSSRIKEGRYRIDPSKVAEAMLEEIRALRAERGLSKEIRKKLNPTDLEPLLEAVGVRRQPRP